MYTISPSAHWNPPECGQLVPRYPETPVSRAEAQPGFQLRWQSLKQPRGKAAFSNALTKCDVFMQSDRNTAPVATAHHAATELVKRHFPMKRCWSCCGRSSVAWTRQGFPQSRCCGSSLQVGRGMLSQRYLSQVAPRVQVAIQFASTEALPKRLTCTFTVSDVETGRHTSNTPHT